MTFPLAFLTSNEYTEGHPFLKKQPNFRLKLASKIPSEAAGVGSRLK
jgi:hypothetical protein